MNEVENYIFGTLKRQDIALRGITRDLKKLKAVNRNTVFLTTVGTYALLYLVLDIKNMKIQIKNMNEKIEMLKDLNEYEEEGVN